MSDTDSMSVDTTGVVSPTTTTAGQAAALSGVTNRNSSSPATAAQASQFGQFRLTTFVDSNPRPNTTASALAGTSSSANASPVPRPASVPVAFEKNMAASTALNGGQNENASPIAHAAKIAQMGVAAHGLNSSLIQMAPMTAKASIQAVSGAMHRRTASAKATLPFGHNAIQHGMNNGFGVLDLTTPIIPQGKLSQHRDGRVRNPVPRKLKGKTDMRNGNFSVMHMDMSGALGDGKAGESRGEAAQRTSENTAKAAREAARDKEGGGKPIKRRRVDGEGAWEPILSGASQSRASMDIDGPMIGQMSINAPGPPKEVVHRTEMMTPEEVKWEQARLLTTLRSINPLTVVDQICKALAFFGGIPGAPPPEDGSFPDSADANGTGALFVGWLSEIFPDLERRSWASTAKAPEPQLIPRGKRPRGRPKGSKASKVRKDKGIKKGAKDGAVGLSNNNPISAGDGDDPADEDWVDIGIGDHDGAGGGDAANGGDIMIMDEVIGSAAPQITERRRPGRPRGSKNGKKKDGDGNDVQGDDSMMQDIEGEDSQPAVPPMKRKVGRPPGSKTKPKDGAPLTPVTPVHSKSAPRPVQSRAKSVVSGAMPADLSAEERAVLEAFRKNRALVPEGPSAVPKKKRPSRAKQKPAPAEAAHEQSEAAQAGGNTPEMLAQQLNVVPLAASQAQKMAATAPSTNAIKPPPPKRQRKAKEPAQKATATLNTNIKSGIDPSLQITQTMSAPPHLQPSQQSQPQPRSSQPQRPSSMSANPYTSPQLGSNNSMGNPLHSMEALMAAPTPTPLSTNAQSSRPQPQGLEAHYARFETLQGDRAESTHSPTAYTIGGSGGANNMAQQRGGGMNRSPIQNNTSNNLYYQPHPQTQAQRTHSMGGSNQTGYGYNQGQQTSRGNPYTMETYGGGTHASLASNTLSGNSQAPQNRSAVAYGVQSQNQNPNPNQNDYFSAAATNYVDLPALETGVGYGGRSTNYSGGGMTGVGMGSGGIGNGGIGGGLFAGNGQGTLSESELREQLTRANMARR